jgi:hypothetical protein
LKHELRIDPSWIGTDELSWFLEADLENYDFLKLTIDSFISRINCISMNLTNKCMSRALLELERDSSNHEMLDKIVKSHNRRINYSKTFGGRRRLEWLAQFCDVEYKASLVNFCNTLNEGVHDNLDIYVNPDNISSHGESQKVVSKFGYYKYRVVYDKVTRTNTRINIVKSSKQRFETFAGFSYFAGKTDYRGNSRLGKVVHAPIVSRIGYITGVMPRKARDMLGNP